MGASKAVLGYGTLICRRATVGTTTIALVIAAGAGVVVTPLSMTGIVVGQPLAIDVPGSALYEIVVPTAVTGTTFTATFTQSHLVVCVVALMVTFAELFKLGGPNQKQDTKDSSNFNSPGGRKEFMSGMKESGEVSLEGAYLNADATQQNLQADFDNGTLSNYSIIWPSPLLPIWFAALVVSIQPSTPLDDRITFTTTLKISGPIFPPRSVS